VADTSAVVDYLIGTDLGVWVSERLESEPQVHAPHLLDVEVVGVLRRLVRARDVTRRRAEQALGDLIDLRIARYAHVPLLPRMWDLRDNVPARDAAFVALAELLDAELVTTDRRLAAAPGVRAKVVTP
jgi:predicted nucleic acid-binding protein